LAAGRYLCAGDIDTRTPEGLRAAIFRYNQSDDYVAAVVSIASAYRDNAAPVIPDPAPVEVTEAPVAVTTTTPPPSPVEVTPSAATPSTTEPTRPTRPGICTVTPNTSSAPPWAPAMPVVTCKPRTPVPTPSR
jgi:hypothetical protein